MIAGRVLPLQIIENPRARRLTLRIDAGGSGLRVTIPPGVPSREVDLFLARYEGWLRTRLENTPLDTWVRPGMMLPLRGVAHTIVHDGQKRGNVHAVINLAGEAELIVHGDEAHLPRRVADYLKLQARNDILPLVNKHCQTIGRKASAVRFKDTKSRWGSCTSKGVLSFSWRIVMAPSEIIDYLVAHEVAHLAEMNHSPAFWRVCHRLCPQTEQCRDWLKRNGTALQAIRFMRQEEADS